MKLTCSASLDELKQLSSLGSIFLHDNVGRC